MPHRKKPVSTGLNWVHPMARFAQALEFVYQRPAADSKGLGCGRAIVFELLKRRQNSLGLNFLQTGGVVHFFGSETCSCTGADARG